MQKNGGGTFKKQQGILDNCKRKKQQQWGFFFSRYIALKRQGITGSVLFVWIKTMQERRF